MKIYSYNKQKRLVLNYEFIIITYLKRRLSQPYFNIVDDGYTYIYATRDAIKAFCPEISLNTIGKYLKIMSSENGILVKKKLKKSGGYWYAFKNMKNCNKDFNI